MLVGGGSGRGVSTFAPPEMCPQTDCITCDL